jgi:hypothetical protein
MSVTKEDLREQNEKLAKVIRQLDEENSKLIDQVKANLENRLHGEAQKIESAAGRIEEAADDLEDAKGDLKNAATRAQNDAAFALVRSPLIYLAGVSAVLWLPREVGWVGYGDMAAAFTVLAVSMEGLRWWANR